MAGQILIPFNSHLRVEDIISVIEEASKPGMRVVFLVHYPVDPWAWFRDHWVTTESSRDAMLAGRKVIAKYSCEGQRALAEEMVAPWRYVLQKMGVKATVDVYTGSLSSVVENYSRGDDVSLVMRAQNDFPLMGFFHRSIGFILKTAWSITGEVTTMKLRRIAIYALAALALLFGGLVVYNSDLSIGTRGEVTFLSLSIQSPYSSQVAKRLLVPGSLPEEPEWLSKAQNNPDPRIRLNAITAWAKNPTESLDPITYSLLDQDGSVRGQAQKLLQDTLARR